MKPYEQRTCPRRQDCMPRDLTPDPVVSLMPVLPLAAYNAFKAFTGLTFVAGTRLHRAKGSPHIFAVTPGQKYALCVYRHTRTFGE